MLRHAARTIRIGVLPLLLGACSVVGTSTEGPRAAERRSPVVQGQLILAGGTYGHDIDSSVDDDTGAGFLGFNVEGASRSGFGGGLSLEVTSSEDDLFESQGGASLQATGVEVAPYFLWRAIENPRFRMPLRVGPWIDTLVLEDQDSDDKATWVSLGLRLAVDPEVVLISNPNLEFTLRSQLSVAAGTTRISVDTDTDDQEFDSDGTAFGFEFGPRLYWSHFYAGVSYLHRSHSVDESDTENLNGAPTVVLAFDNSFDGLALTFGGGF